MGSWRAVVVVLGVARGPQQLTSSTLVIPTRQLFLNPSAHTAMATMQMIEKVQANAADGGLASVLEVSRVHQLVVDLIKNEGVQDLTEFSTYFTQDGYEKEAGELCDQVESLKGRKIEVARVRAAIVLARAVLERPKESKDSTPAPPIDIEGPLDPAAKESMAKAWTMRYNLTLTMWLDPADPLVNRLYREFRNNGPTLIAVTRMKSVYTDNNPNPEKKVALAGGLMVTLEGKDQGEVVKNVAQYYFALRVLANACAKAGNYEVESKTEKDVKVIFAPLDTNLDYADHAFRMALKQSGSAWTVFKWLEERDLHTRGLMCNYMRCGYPQGEALVKAVKEAEIKWSTPTERGGQEGDARRQRSRTPRRGGKGGGKGKVQKPLIGKTQQKTVQKVGYANMAKGGKQFCRAYNNGSCDGDRCPHGNLHVCNVITNGKTCMLKHPAVRHNFSR